MEASNNCDPVTFAVESDSACDAWKRCTVEVVNLLSKSSKPSLIKDYNCLLLENIDLKKQNKIAIAALDSIISNKENILKNIENVNKLDEARGESKRSGVSKNGSLIETVALIHAEPCVRISKEPFPVEHNFINTSALTEVVNVPSNFKTKEISNVPRPENPRVSSPLKSKATNIQESVASVHADICNKISKELLSDEHNIDASAPTELVRVTSDYKTKEKSKAPRLENPKLSSPLKSKAKSIQESLCSNCLKSQVPPVSNIDSTSAIKLSSEEDIFNLKQELAQAHEDNKSLNSELQYKIKENDDLRDQIQSLELSVETLTEAVNLQDEQLIEYGNVVSSLRKSRAQILDKMKEANARNAYNVKIMANIEEEVELLRRQLDAYNDLLDNQNVHRIDKASSTDNVDDEDCKNYEIMKKDNYITMLQDRLCEAIVDLKNKDSEIKNHANSVKELINNYETEKKCLEERLKSANVSAEKLEENRIKQQETMKQLMKLIEFLQEKLEKINKK